MPKKCWNLALAGLLLGACCSVLAESKPRFIVDRFGPERGLPQSCVFAITQSRDGYLWVATLGGLARFDGRRFTVFDRDNTPGLKSNRIFNLFEDSRGNLWIGTEKDGIMLVSGTGEILTPPMPPQGGPALLKAACEDASGTVWLHTADTGSGRPGGHLFRFSNNRIFGWELKVPSDTRALIVDDSGLLWLGLDSSLISLQAGLAGGIGGVVPDEVRVGHLDFLLASRKGGYWRLADRLIRKFHNRVDAGFRVHPKDEYPWDQARSPVMAVCEDLEGNLVAGTLSGEVYWFDSAGGYTRIAGEAGLPSNSVLSLHVDREGCLWIGTNGDDLFRVRRQVFDVLETSARRVVQSVCPDGHGGLWIGYNEDHLEHWTPGTNSSVATFTNFHQRPIGMKDWGNLGAVCVDRSGMVWAGTQNEGLFQLRGDTFKSAPGLRSINWQISALQQDRQGSLWVGTEGGLARWDGTNWRTYTTLDGLSTNAVKAITEDREGNLWIGTDGGGINRLRDDRFSWFTRTNGLPSDSVASLLVDKEGVLWAGTSSGLARFRNGNWTSFTRRQGLISGIGYMAEDDQGYLWLGSTAGLVRVAKQALNDFADGRTTNTLSLRIYGEPDGLPTSECTFGSQPAACRTPDGKLWFPTIRGLVSVDPSRLQPNTNEVPVVIESVSIGGRPQTTNSLRLAPLKSVVVPPRAEGLVINFTSLNLAAAERARFRYWMEGHERDWTPPGEERRAYYGKLPPGQYTFHVTACNEDGIWNTKGCTLAVTVLPPFWQTWWFLSLMGLWLLGMVIGFVYYVSTQRLQRELAVLRQHEALEKERARIARDLHDQLGANLTQVALLGEMAEGDKDLPDEVEGHARQISQTARDTTNALDEIVWTVNPANDTLDGLINYICKYAQDYLGMACLRYRLDVPPQLPAVPISPELRHNVFLVAKEAINNVVKHAGASSAWLRLRLEPASLLIEIEDDGKGLPAGAESKGRNGLRNMRKRMEDIDGTFTIGPGAGRGTLVRLSAPLPNTI